VSVDDAAAPVRRLVLACGQDGRASDVLRHDYTRPAVGDTATLAHDLRDRPWPWPDGAFDEVVGVGLPERAGLTPEDLLAECARLLAPGGRLLLAAGPGGEAGLAAVAAAAGGGWRAGGATGEWVELVRG
jgi:SAM-dependent methyltransferase